MAFFQVKCNGLDWATAWFSSSIGIASEMVNVAEKYDTQVDKVVAAHSLRIMLLVILIPLFMGVCLGVDFNHIYRSHEASFTPSTVLFLFLISLVIAKVFNHYAILNAWLLGSIVVIGILSFSGILNLKLPNGIIYFGQLCIGWSLGSKFPFDFLKVQKRFITVTIVLNGIAVALSLALAWGLTYVSSADLKIMILGLSPGGIAEMSLTAKAIGLAVPIVVAFQLTRLIFVIVTTRFFYRYFEKYLA